MRVSDPLAIIERMNGYRGRLEEISTVLREITGSLLASGVVRAADDDTLLEVLQVAAQIGRSADAVMIEATTQVIERCELPVRADRLCARLGCATPSELLQRATRLSRSHTHDLITAAKAVHQPLSLHGERLDPELPALRDAVTRGDAGLDAVVAIAGPLNTARPRAGRTAILAADEELAAAATGTGPTAAPPATTEELRTFARIWTLVLDPDGAEPRAEIAARKRGLHLGHPTDGLIPLRGHLLPEVAGQLQRLADAILNPRHNTVTFQADNATGDDDPDPALADHRTGGQKLHDAFAIMLHTAAAAAETPTLGGAAPTLVVSVRQEDLTSGRGWAHIDGCDEPVSLHAATHTGCVGTIQRVIHDSHGRIISITTTDRVFNAHQRRAITLRDGGCIIPGCGVRATWCEIHHVQEHAKGGRTHTSNGVLLCWHHHRTLDTGGWSIRMNNGIPEVRGPHWWDRHTRWRPHTTSPTHTRQRMRTRTHTRNRVARG